MDRSALELRPNKFENRNVIITWFFNPIIAFLAFPSKAEDQFDAFFKNFLNEETCLEIYLDDDLIGCIILEFKSEMRIRSIFIDQKYRGQKYARMVLEMLIERFPETLFTAYIHQHQREHMLLFERCGFKKTDQLQEFKFEGKAQKFFKFVR